MAMDVNDLPKPGTDGSQHPGASSEAAWSVASEIMKSWSEAKSYILQKKMRKNEERSDELYCYASLFVPLLTLLLSLHPHRYARHDGGEAWRSIDGTMEWLSTLSARSGEKPSEKDLIKLLDTEGKVLVVLKGTGGGRSAPPAAPPAAGEVREGIAGQLNSMFGSGGGGIVKGDGTKAKKLCVTRCRKKMWGREGDDFKWPKVLDEAHASGEPIKVQEYRQDDGGWRSIFYKDVVEVPFWQLRMSAMK